MAADAEKVGASGVNQHAVAWHSRHAWRSCLLPRPTGLLPPSFGSDPGARQLSPDLGASQSAFLAAGLKPLSARDEYLKSKALDSHRKSALKKWVSLVSCGVQCLGSSQAGPGALQSAFLPQEDSLRACRTAWLTRQPLRFINAWGPSSDMCTFGSFTMLYVCL